MNHMKLFDFDTHVHRIGTSSDKWTMYEQRGILPFWLADMDFKSPQAVMEALHQRVEHGVFGYTSAPKELVEVVICMLETAYGWKIESEWLVWLPGLVTGINIACRAVGEDGDDVLTAVPVYPPFLTAPKHSRRNSLRASLMLSDGKWGFDLERLENAATPRTSLFLLCNPHNPVGRAYSREELTAVADFCVKRDMVICSDEIHCDLILDQDKKHIPIATLGPDVAARTITLMAPSKTFNLPGLGCAFAVISNEDLRKRFRSAMAGIVPHVNALGYTAALAAYKHGAAWLSELLDYLRGNRDIVERAIDSMPGLSMTHVEATYLGWIDTREAGLKGPVKFFEAAGVGLGNGSAFDGRGFLRLTFGCPRSILMDGLGKMEASLSRLQRKTDAQ
ncbi:MAG: putative C-S lyase [Desulfomonile tiedjei]|uniref:cysteine-S-conjugate beta-lyase n=1 Tax=Desulfomonile tiedjei TaxID=2358 RepID=A0A9D6V4D6_9BACT|nr:putative C-S lyase [Desulfomonile tiedjei]